MPADAIDGNGGIGTGSEAVLTISAFAISIAVSATLCNGSGVMLEAVAGSVTTGVDDPISATAAPTTFASRAASSWPIPLARGASMPLREAVVWMLWSGASLSLLPDGLNSHSAAAIQPARTLPQNAPTKAIRCDLIAIAVRSQIAFEHDCRVKMTM